MNLNICEKTYKEQKSKLQDIFSKNPDDVDYQKEYNDFKQSVVSILGDAQKLNAFHVAAIETKHYYAMKKLFCRDKLEKVNHEFKRDVLKMYVTFCRECQSFNVNQY